MGEVGSRERLVGSGKAAAACNDGEQFSAINMGSARGTEIALPCSLRRCRCAEAGRRPTTWSQPLRRSCGSHQTDRRLLPLWPAPPPLLLPPPAAAYPVLLARLHLQSVTLHTNLGDIKLELFCEDAPRTGLFSLAGAAAAAPAARCSGGGECTVPVSQPWLLNSFHSVAPKHLRCSCSTACCVTLCCAALRCAAPCPPALRSAQRERLATMPSLPLPLLAAAENFLALAASGYYNDCKFHRNIKAFMVQV